MTENAVEVSVVIPCWNVSPYLARCLDSVFAALPPSAEILAVDDGSTDDTAKILEARAASDPRLRVLVAPHRGVSAARNAALDQAKGRLVFFADADDEVDPDFFRAMTEALDLAGADLCVCAFAGSKLKGDYRFGTNAGIVADFLPRVFGYSFDDVRAWYRGRSLFADREMAGATRFVFRRDFLERHRLRFDEDIELYEDAMFVSACLLKAESMTCVDRPLYRVTTRDEGAMRSIPRDGLRLCRNKLALLRRRRALDDAAGGRLAPLYAGSCVLSALEMLAAVVRGRCPRRAGRALLRQYLSEPSVSAALAAFPLSFRRPLVACAVLFLRMIPCQRPAEKGII